MDRRGSFGSDANHPPFIGPFYCNVSNPSRRSSARKTSTSRDTKDILFPLHPHPIDHFICYTLYSSPTTCLSFCIFLGR